MQRFLTAEFRMNRRLLVFNDHESWNYQLEVYDGDVDFVIDLHGRLIERTYGRFLVTDGSYAWTRRCVQRYPTIAPFFTILSQHRFYAHTADPLYEDGYNMASIEAMTAGLPVSRNRLEAAIDKARWQFLNHKATQ